MPVAEVELRETDAASWQQKEEERRKKTITGGTHCEVQFVKHFTPVKPFNQLDIVQRKVEVPTEAAATDVSAFQCHAPAAGVES